MSSTYRVTNSRAPRDAADAKVRAIAEAIRAQLSTSTPRDTGRFAGAWTVSKGRVPAVYLVTNSVPYGRYVEYGTRNMAARPVMGQVLTQWHARVGR